MRPRKKKSRIKQIQRERCRLDGSEPSQGLRNPVPMSNVMPGIMKKLGMEDQHWLAVLEDEWPAIVGDAVSKHSRPGMVKDSNLTVFVDSSVWMSELSRHGKGTMLGNLQARFGPKRVKTIGFRLDPDS